MMSTTIEQPVLRNWKVPFFTVWIGQAISLLGSQLVQFALVWWLTQTTGSATVLATATLVALLPQVFLGPIAGVVVDRWNRKLVMIVADGLIALATLGLAALFYMGHVQVWQVYVLLFIRSAAGGFHWPAMQASTSLMVPKEHLARIQGLNQMLSGMMNIGAAPLGALLLGILPMQGILSIDVITAAIAITLLLFVHIPQPDKIEAAQMGKAKPSMWLDLKAGFRYVAAWPGLLIIGLMATLINMLLTPTSSLQPLLVTRHFGGQAMQLAYMETAWGIGAVAGGVTLSIWGGFRRRIVTSMVGLIVLGVCILAIGLMPAWAFWLAVLFTFVVGFTNPLVNGPLFAAVQAVVEPDMQGRVFTLIGSAAAAMSPLGLIIAGPVADAFGIRSWFLVGGIVTLLIGAVSFLIPAVMHFEDGRNRPSEQSGQPDSIAVLAGAPVEISGD
jgi:MFS transporter, DHA3 family, macrolide efflux protein